MSDQGHWKNDKQLELGTKLPWTDEVSKKMADQGHWKNDKQTELNTTYHHDKYLTFKTQSITEVTSGQLSSRAIQENSNWLKLHSRTNTAHYWDFFFPQKGTHQHYATTLSDLAAPFSFKGEAMGLVGDELEAAFWGIALLRMMYEKSSSYMDASGEISSTS